MNVTGCTYGGPFTDIKELVGVFKRGTSARSSGQLDFGPSSQFAACLFSLDLTQIITYQGQPPIVIKSRLQFCEIPSTEILVAEGSGGGQQLSLQLKRSLVQFRNVVRSLSAGGDAPDYANYDSSKLMQLLRDGESCLLLCVSSIYFFDCLIKTILLDKVNLTYNFFSLFFFSLFFNHTNRFGW